MDGAERTKAKLKMRLAELLHQAPEQLRNAKEVREQLRQIVRSLPPKEYAALQLTEGQEDQFIQEILAETSLADPLEPLMNDASISEIMVNGPDEVFVERNGRSERVAIRFNNQSHLMGVVERLLDSVGLSVTESNPICDARLPDGSRLNVIIHPVVLNGPVITIRRKTALWNMADYLRVATLSQHAADFLQACVKARVNIVLSGGTSTGKTTLVTVLAESIPAHERIITIENVAELEMMRKEQWIRLVGKAPNLEGRGEISLRVLVRNALRMRPDRIILGEARGGEALDVVQAMQTGHDGFITVLHANSPRGALERLQTLMLMSGIDLPPSTCQMQIAHAVDLVVHMARFVDGSRRISAITQVLGASTEGFQMEDVFVFDVDGFSPGGLVHGTCRYTGATPKCLDKFRMNNVEVPSWVTR